MFENNFKIVEKIIYHYVQNRSELSLPSLDIIFIFEFNDIGTNFIPYKHYFLMLKDIFKLLFKDGLTIS